MISEHHRVQELDVLKQSGAHSLSALSSGLDHGSSLAVVTEGLLGYLDYDAVTSLWRRFATALEEFRHGVYISDIHIGELQDLRVRVFGLLLSVFVRGRVHLHSAINTRSKARCGRPASPR
jgi:O-methyltransferase involved in polyketide biosynthesis